jgi:hypothetical protein
MDANQDREWRAAPYLYPNPFDSRVRAENPDYHPPVYYLDGKFWADPKQEKPLTLKQVPAYIQEAARQWLAAPAVRRPITITADPTRLAEGGVDARSLLHDLTVANQPPEPVMPKKKMGWPKGKKRGTRTSLTPMPTVLVEPASE